MSDSKKLPIIEIGDTVVFRTDLVVGKYYDHLSFKRSMIKHLGQSRTVQQLSDVMAFYIGDGFWYSFEMVAEVIKPSKARVYSEIEMIDFADKYAEYSYRESMNNRFKSPMSANEYFQSLNK